MRIAYLDEAGISNPVQEPYLVVAGIIIDGDKHWRPLEEHFRALAERYLPDDPAPLFHAKDIFHGTGKFSRDEWPRERRWHLLSELAEIPRKYDLPVVFGFNNRQRHGDEVRKVAPQAPESTVQRITHADAFIKAAMCVEGWMRRVTRNETVIVIAEDTPKIKKLLKSVHAGYSDRVAKVPENKKAFQSAHIIETVYFAEKSESMPLQVADACAFIIKRHLMDRFDVDSLYGSMRSQLLWWDNERNDLFRYEVD